MRQGTREGGFFGRQKKTMKNQNDPVWMRAAEKILDPGDLDVSVVTEKRIFFLL